MHKLTIPQPCHEKWENMTPQGNGAFCNQCSKVVVDFTQMSDEEVQNYFIQHAHQKLCGRFKSEQLDNVRIQIPFHLIYKEPSFLKRFILISLVVFGTTLYSCTGSKQTTTGVAEFKIVHSTDTVPKKNNDKTIGEIATPVGTVTKNCNKDSEIELGDIVVVPEDTVKRISTDTTKTKMGKIVMKTPIRVNSTKNK